MSALALIAPTILQSTALAARLSGGRSARAEADRALALLFGVNAIALTVSLVPVSEPDLAAVLVVLTLPLAFLFEPLAFAYARAMRGGPQTSRAILRRHVVPWSIAGLLLALPIAAVVGTEGTGAVTRVTFVMSILAIVLFAVVNAGYTVIAVALATARRRAPSHPTFGCCAGW